MPSGEWTGVPLHVILEMAGIVDAAAYVNLTLMTRATDELGHTQPDLMPINIFNMIHPHPVTVITRSGSEQ